MTIADATHAVRLDDAHIVAVDPEEEHGERGGVDDAQAVSLSGLERERRVLVEADGGRRARGRREGGGREVREVLWKVDEGGVCGVWGVGKE